jgi:thiol-disulfide isomerase/thioredoxin
LLVGLLIAATVPARAQNPAPAPAWRGYDEQADARADIDRARSMAAAAGRQVLVVFGANWCGDCRALDTAMKQAPLQSVIDARYVVVKVDVGRFNRNVDIAERYGVPLKKGVPTIAVLGADGGAVFATSGGELADARSMGEDQLRRFFDRRF